MQSGDRWTETRDGDGTGTETGTATGTDTGTEGGTSTVTGTDTGTASSQIMIIAYHTVNPVGVAHLPLSPITPSSTTPDCIRGYPESTLSGL